MATFLSLAIIAFSFIIVQDSELMRTPIVMWDLRRET